MIFTIMTKNKIFFYEIIFLHQQLYNKYNYLIGYVKQKQKTGLKIQQFEYSQKIGREAMKIYPIQFPLPIHIDQLRKIQSEQKLKEVIKNLYENQVKITNQQQFPMFPYRFHKSQHIKMVYIRLKCRYCNSFLSFSKKDDQKYFRLFKFQTKHLHSQNVISKKERVFKYLKQMNDNDKVQGTGKDDQAKKNSKKLMRKFGLTQRYAKKLLTTFIRSSSKNIQQLKQTFESNNTFYYHWPLQIQSDQIPDISLLITPTMKKLFETFGFNMQSQRHKQKQKSKQKYEQKICNSQLQYQFQQQISSFSNQTHKVNDESTINKKNVTQKQLAIGFITGINNNLQIIVFGIFAVAQQNKHNITSVLKQFFNYMQSQCQSIIINPTIFSTNSTKNNNQYQNALQDINKNLNSKIIHLLDHSNFSYKANSLLNLIKQAANQPSPARYEMIKQKSCQKIHKQQNTHYYIQYERFINQAKNFCLSQVPPVFVGILSISNQIQHYNQQLSKTLASSLPLTYNKKTKSTYYKLMPYLVHICNNINKNAQKKYQQQQFQTEKFELQKYCKIEYINVCRSKLPRNVFVQLLENLFRTRFVDSQEEEAKGYYVCWQFGLERKFYVTPKEYISSQGKKILYHQCSCNYKIKTHLPCSHILKITNNMWDEVGHFWKINKNDELPCNEEQQKKQKFQYASQSQDSQCRQQKRLIKQQQDSQYKSEEQQEQQKWKKQKDQTKSKKQQQQQKYEQSEQSEQEQYEDQEQNS